MTPAIELICWIALAFSTLGVTGFGVLLRVNSQHLSSTSERLTVCERAREKFHLTLAEVQMKLIMLESWKREREEGA